MLMLLVLSFPSESELVTDQQGGSTSNVFSYKDSLLDGEAAHENA
jgi:hypothetical protein